MAWLISAMGTLRAVATARLLRCVLSSCVDWGADPYRTRRGVLGESTLAARGPPPLDQIQRANPSFAGDAPSYLGRHHRDERGAGPEFPLICPCRSCARCSPRRSTRGCLLPKTSIHRPAPGARSLQEVAATPQPDSGQWRSIAQEPSHPGTRRQEPDLAGSSPKTLEFACRLGRCRLRSRCDQAPGTRRQKEPCHSFQNDDRHKFSCESTREARRRRGRRSWSRSVTASHLLLRHVTYDKGSERPSGASQRSDLLS